MITLVILLILLLAFKDIVLKEYWPVVLGVMLIIVSVYALYKIEAIWDNNGLVSLIFMLIFVGVGLALFPLYGGLLSFAPNQNGGFNIDVEQGHTNILKPGHYLPQYSVIFSTGTWKEPQVFGGVFMFVDDVLLAQRQWEAVCSFNHTYLDPGKEYIFSSQSVDVPTQGLLSGEHNLTFLVLNANLDSCSNFISPYKSFFDTCMSDIHPVEGVTSINRFRSGCNLVSVKSERTVYFNVYEDKLPDMNIFQRFIDWIKSIKWM